MNNRKILYIAADNNVAFSGGRQCRNRNLRSLEDINNGNVVTFYIHAVRKYSTLKKIFKRVIDIHKGYLSGVDDDNINEIFSVIITNYISDVFIDGGLIGILAKKIKLKFPDVRIYSFLHNVEQDYFRSYIRNSSLLRKISNFHLVPLAKYNEKNACIYSDKIAVLNDRDRAGIKDYYGIASDYIIPISFDDSFKISTFPDLNTNKNALFVGSFFHGNVDGLVWFCKQVLPVVDIKLTIVGAGMSQLKNILQSSEKINIYDRVDDLTPFYNDCDFVLLPLISGGGMKVKTAEALMYGKFIIGTSEALTGYDYSEKEVILCDTKEEFINALVNLDLKYKFNKYSRDLFKMKYSYNSTLPLFRKFLS